MQTIPFHSLIFSSMENFSIFPVHECLTTQSIKQNLIGDSSIELYNIVVDEMRHRFLLKLSLGERVVVTNDITTDDRKLFTSLAVEQGAYVYDLKNINNINLAQRSPSVERIKNKWNGITVVGDIHGDHNSLKEVLAWADSRKHFVWFLGDIIDYGKDTLKTMQTIYRSVMQEKAAFVMGNHERKIARWLDGKGSVRLNEGNKVTAQALKQLSKFERGQWIGQFQALLAHSSLISQLYNITFAHAGIHSSYWTKTQNEIEIEQFALYGESSYMNGKYKRTYQWVDRIPKGQMVVIGHDKRHAYPIVKTGKEGGEIVFLDTGCGKGGNLSSADFKFNENGLHLECFRRY